VKRHCENPVEANSSFDDSGFFFCRIGGICRNREEKMGAIDTRIARKYIYNLSYPSLWLFLPHRIAVPILQYQLQLVRCVFVATLR